MLRVSEELSEAVRAPRRALLGRRSTDIYVGPGGVTTHGGEAWVEPLTLPSEEPQTPVVHGPTLEGTAARLPAAAADGIALVFGTIVVGLALAIIGQTIPVYVWLCLAVAIPTVVYFEARRRTQRR